MPLIDHLNTREQLEKEKQSYQDRLEKVHSDSFLIAGYKQAIDEINKKIQAIDQPLNRCQALEQEVIHLKFFTSKLTDEQKEKRLAEIKSELEPLYDQLGIDKRMNPLFQSGPPDSIRDPY